MATVAAEEAIVRDLERTGQLHEDPHFPPPPGETWLRPTESTLGASVSLFADSVARENGASISLGSARLGDSWLLGALATVASRPSLLHQLFLSVRGCHCGVYTVQLFIGDSWTPVTVDDRLPCDASGVPLYARSAHPGELWVSLMEKAYAKLLGGYAALRIGHLPTALRALTGGLPLTVPLDVDSSEASSVEPLSWERLRRFAANGAPMSLLRRSPSSNDSAGGGVGGGDGGDADVASVVTAVKSGMMHGLAYPVLRTRATNGSRDVLVSCPWSQPEAPSTCQWIAFDELPALFDVLHVAVAPAVDAAVLTADGADPTISGTKLAVSGEWPRPPSANLNDLPVPAFVLRVAHPIRIALLLEQQLAPRATPPGKVGIALLLCTRPTDDGPPPSLIAHTMPARSHRRAVLDVPAPLPPGEYLLYPHRLAPPGTQPAAFRLEANVFFSSELEGDDVGGGGANGDASGGEAGGAVSLAGLPGGLPNGGADLLDALRGALGTARSGHAPSEERLQDGRALLSQLDERAQRVRQEGAACTLQRTLRGRQQRQELAELAALQAGRNEETADAARTVQAGLRVKLARKEVGKRLEVKSQAFKAKEQAEEAAQAAMRAMMQSQQAALEAAEKAARAHAAQAAQAAVTAMLSQLGLGGSGDDAVLGRLARLEARLERLAELDEANVVSAVGNGHTEDDTAAAAALAAVAAARSSFSLKAASYGLEAEAAAAAAALEVEAERAERLRERARQAYGMPPLGVRAVMGSLAPRTPRAVSEPMSPRMPMPRPRPRAMEQSMTDGYEEAAALFIQSEARGMLARRRIHEEQRAATVVQSTARGRATRAGLVRQVEREQLHSLVEYEALSSRARALLEQSPEAVQLIASMIWRNHVEGAVVGSIEVAVGPQPSTRRGTPNPRRSQPPLRGRPTTNTRRHDDALDAIHSPHTHRVHSPHTDRGFALERSMDAATAAAHAAAAAAHAAARAMRIATEEPERRLEREPSGEDEGFGAIPTGGPPPAPITAPIEDIPRPPTRESRDDELDHLALEAQRLAVRHSNLVGVLIGAHKPSTALEAVPLEAVPLEAVPLEAIEPYGYGMLVGEGRHAIEQAVGELQWKYDQSMRALAERYEQFDLTLDVHRRTLDVRQLEAVERLTQHLEGALARVSEVQARQQQSTPAAWPPRPSRLATRSRSSAACIVS